MGLLFIFFAQAFAQNTPLNILRLQAPEHFISNPQVQQCVAALPTIGWMGFDHTWLFSGVTFGMPYSYTQNAIQGGFAAIRTPDPSLPGLTSDPVCEGVYQPENISTDVFTKKFQCLVSKFSDSQDVIAPDWQPVFVYSWSSSNCHSAVRFMLDCAGGEMSLNPNGGLGSRYSNNEILNVLQKNLNNPSDPEVLNLEKDFAAFILDLPPISAPPADLTSYLTEKSPALLSQTQNLMASLENSQDLRRTGLYRRLQKFSFNLKRWISELQKSAAPLALQNLKNLKNIFRQPDTVKKTYLQVCQQAQTECL